MERARKTAWLGLFGLLGLSGCGEAPSVGQGTAGANRPVAQPAQRAIPHRETTLKPPASLDSARSGAVQVVGVRLPAAPRYRVPQVQLPDAAAAQRINTILTRLLLTDNLEDTSRAATATQAMQRARAAYESSGQTGIFATSYDVLFNQGGLLSLALTVEYSGAYPWASTQHATFEVRTGRQLFLADLLADTLTLRRRWHQRINQRVAAHLRWVAQQYPSDSQALDAVLEYTAWSDAAGRIPARDLPPLREFALSPRGLLLYTRFWFPHAVLALSPNDEYLFPRPQALRYASGSGRLLWPVGH